MNQSPEHVTTLFLVNNYFIPREKLKTKNLNLKSLKYCYEHEARSLKVRTRNDLI